MDTLSGFKSKFIGIESTGRNIGTGFIRINFKNLDIIEERYLLLNLMIM